MKRIVSLFVLAATLLPAQGLPTPSKKLWLLSIAALAAGTTLDAASSWHQPESNPLLASHSTFGGKGISIKFGLAAGSVIPQFFFPRHRKLFAVVNFAQAGAFTGVAVHNWRLGNNSPVRTPTPISIPVTQTIDTAAFISCSGGCVATVHY